LRRVSRPILNKKRGAHSIAYDGLHVADPLADPENCRYITTCRKAIRFAVALLHASCSAGRNATGGTTDHVLGCSRADCTVADR
jgi:hypothetical protein